MKTCLILMAAFAACSLAAQPDQPDRKPDHTVKDKLSTVTVPHDAGKLLELRPAPPNEIQGHRVTYSGVAVQIIKVKKPLQLINPFAPAEYGSGDANLDRDIITGKPTGFKFLSFKF